MGPVIGAAKSEKFPIVMEKRRLSRTTKATENKGQIQGHKTEPAEKEHIGTGEMAQWVKSLAAKPKDLGLVPIQWEDLYSVVL